MHTCRPSFRAALLLACALAPACTGEVASPDDSAPSAPSPAAPAMPGAPNAPGGGAPNTSPPGSMPTGPASPGAPSGGADPSTPPPAGTTPPSTPPPEGATARVGLAARISKVEYAHSVADVLGVTLTAAELDAATGGIPDDAGDGVFKHIADKQTSVEQHATAYFEVAEAVARRVDVAALAGKLATCMDATPECGATTIAALGSRLYRRPLEQREVDAMLTVFNAALAQQLDYAGAVRWTLEAMLQAPQFLFHLQHETRGVAGQPRELDGHELAARLASFLWVSVPDDALLAAAAEGRLGQPDVLAAEVLRMLADPKAQRFTQTFIEDFSRARLASYEGATDADRSALNESVIATFQDHLWTQKRSVADLFVTTRFVVNPRVAEILGVPHSGSGLETVDVSTLPERLGLMTHPGVIAGMGDRAVGSFVNRGKYLMERLLCRHPAAVPAALLEELENFNADTTGLNEHERAAIRKTRPVCWGCHTQFEPFAFGFSRFDGAGRYVGEVDMAGKPLPLDGWVPTAAEDDSPKYTNIAEYMQILATEPVIQTCMTEHFIAFATARSTDDLAKLEAERVGQQYLAGGSTLAAMVSAVVGSPLFKTVVTVPATAPGAGN